MQVRLANINDEHCRRLAVQSRGLSTREMGSILEGARSLELNYLASVRDTRLSITQDCLSLSLQISRMSVRVKQTS